MEKYYKKKFKNIPLSKKLTDLGGNLIQPFTIKKLDIAVVNENKYVILTAIS